MVELHRQITIKDIALRGNVSIGTVDRVLHNRGEVSEETRTRILSIIDEMKYQPNVLASTLASKKQFVLATLFPTPLSGDGYWNKPVIGIKKRAEELHLYGFHLVQMTFNQFDPADFTERTQKILSLDPDGIVLAPFFYKESMIFISELKNRNIPFVFIDSDIPGQGQIAYVGQNSFQCGLLSAKLLSLVTPPGGQLWVIHFGKEMDNQNHLVQRERGFYEWFRFYEPQRRIRTYEILTTETVSCEKQLMPVFAENPPSGIFVTNSKVFLAAQYIEKHRLPGIRLAGHDMLLENIRYLKKGIVDFLICQHPEEQGYNAIDKLFQNVVQRTPVRKQNYTPIDIIMAENVDFYTEFN